MRESWKRWSVPFLVLVAACGGGGSSGPKDHVDVEPWKSTRMLTAADLESLQAASNDGVLVFEGTPAGLSGVAVGDVIVGGIAEQTPGGFLRIVSEVREEGDRLVLRTMHAPLQLAFKRVHVRTTRATVGIGAMPLTKADGVPGLSQNALGGDATATQPINFVVFDGDGDEETKDDQIVIDGEIGGGFDYDLGIDVDWGDAFDDLPGTAKDCAIAVVTGVGAAACLVDALPEVKVSFDVNPEIHAKVEAAGSAVLEYEKTVPIATLHLTPVVLGPLIFTPTVDIEGKIKGGASGRFSTGLEGFAKFHTSVEVSSKGGEPVFQEPELTDGDFGATDTTISLQATARASVGAKLTMSLYAVAGPYATADVFAEVAADPFADPCWNLNLGMTGTLGVTVTTPKLPLLGDVALVDFAAPPVEPFALNVDSGECMIGAADAPELPPGAGPDAKALSMPSFEPWSVAFDGPFDGSSSTSPGLDGLAFTQLYRSIDGRYLVASSGSDALLKFDETGKATWAASYHSSEDLPPLSVLHVESALDGGNWVLTRDDSANPIGVLGLEQDGTPRKRITLGATAACSVEPVTLVRRPNGGITVLGTCTDETSVLLFDLDPDGVLVGTTQIADSNVLHLRPYVLVPVGDELVVAGEVSAPGGDRLFAMRLAADNTLISSSFYEGCEEAPDLFVNGGAVGENGTVTIVGSAAAHHLGFIGRIDRDGDIGFARFPNLGTGASDIYVLTSIAALPTGGFVVAGSTQNLLADPPASTPSVVVSQVDVAGQTLWAKDFHLQATSEDALRAVAHPAVRVTDDGGALVVAQAAPDGEDNTGALWALKMFAKNGELSFDADKAQGDAFTPEQLTCAVTPLEWEPTLASVEAEVEVGDLFSKSVTVIEARQQE